MLHLYQKMELYDHEKYIITDICWNNQFEGLLQTGNDTYSHASKHDTWALVYESETHDHVDS